MDKSKTNNERLAVLETKVENVELILSRLETKIDLLSSGFVTREEFNSLRGNRWRDGVIQVIIAGIIGALLAYFVAGVTH